ncbi:unnamed protein product [Discosporangium mesarthrocarpum]
MKPCILTGVALVSLLVGTLSFNFPLAAPGSVRSTIRAPAHTRWTTPRMSTTEKEETTTPVVPPTAKPSTPKPATIVTVNTENVEFSAGLLGGFTGFVIGGPVLGALLAVAANYGSKRENEAGEAVRAIAKNAIEAFNFLSGVNSKYDVAGKAGASLEDAVSKIKESDDTETVTKVQDTLSNLTKQATKLSEEYDLAAKAKQALGVAGELTDTAIEKSLELEKEYSITSKVKEAAQKAIDGAQDAAKKAT